MTILHDNGIIEASGERPRDRIRNTWRWENESQAGRLTWAVAERQVMRPRKEFDPRPVRIEEWIGLRAVLRLRALLWEDRKHFQNRYGTSYAVESRFCEGKVNRAQLCGDDHGLKRMDVIH